MWFLPAFPGGREADHELKCQSPGMLAAPLVSVPLLGTGRSPGSDTLNMSPLSVIPLADSVQVALLRMCQLWVNQADLGVACSAEGFSHALHCFCLVNPFSPMRLQPQLAWRCIAVTLLMGLLLAFLSGMLEAELSTTD